ncbi:MAG TPA: hypothetical protein VFV15_00325 [Moraxellaceae bacterium]|nr:hypothetical protein [Moraxellaceae bacterium]
MLLLVAAQGAVAEERFYPIIGPDGSIRVIHSGAPAPRGDESRPATPGQAPAAATAAPAGTGERAQPVASPAAQPAFAPYDSEEYADSEALEQAVKADANRKRFYLIQDGMGQQRLDEGGGNDESLLAPAPVAAAPVSGPRERFQELQAQRRELDPAAGLARHPALPACQPAERLRDAKVLVAAEPLGLVVDTRTYTFLDEAGVVAAYEVAGQGLRTVALRSYSRKDKNPAFVHPDLAFLDGRGCVTRVVSGYFERLYAATDRRHPMLSAELAVHAEEAYLLVLAPVRKGEAPALPFAEARTGQLKLTLRK